MGNYYSYMRISTNEERNLQKDTRQERALHKFATEHNFEFWKEFKDDASGSSFNRKEWKKLESGVVFGDTIVFKDISRFTRETENGYLKYMQLLNKGVELIFIDNPTLSTNYVKNLINNAKEMDTIPKLFAEFMIKILLITELDRVEKEREILCKRIKDGIEASEKKSGRKKGQLDKLTPALEADITLYLSDRTITQLELMNKHQISRNTLKKYIHILQRKE